MPKAFVYLVVAALSAGLAGAVFAQSGEVSVELNSPVVLEGDHVGGTVSGGLTGQSFTVSWVDPFGQTFAARRTIGDRRGRGEFSLRALGAVTPFGYVRAARERSQSQTPLTVLPKYDTFWEGFAVVAAKPPEATTANSFACRFLGIEAALGPGYAGALSAARVALRPIAEGLISPGVLSMTEEAFNAARDRYEGSGDAEPLVRIPGLSDRRELERLSNELSQQAELVRTLAPAGVIVAQRPSTAYGNAPLDVSFGERDLAEFAVFAASRAGAAGEEGLRGASRVVPLTARQVRKRILDQPQEPVNLALWAFHREYMDRQLSGAVAALSRAAKTAVRRPGGENVNWSIFNVPTGMTGALGPSAYGGFDWTMLSGTTDFLVMSADAPRWSWSLVRDMSYPRKVLARVDLAKSGAGDALWRSAADGMAGVVVENAGAYLAEAVEAAAKPAETARLLTARRVTARAMRRDRGPVETFAPQSETGTDVADALRALKAGIGDIPATAERVATVAVVYSPESVRAGWMMEYLGGEGTAPAPAEAGSRGMASWSRLLGDLGIDFEWVSMRDVAAGELLNRRFQATVLPEVWCVSPEEVMAMAAYVKVGGVLMVDYAAGLLDGNYAAYSKPPLDELLGIRRDMLTGARARALGSESRTGSLNAPADRSAAVRRAATSIRARVGADGKRVTLPGLSVSSRSRAGASVLPNSFGNGKTFYVNRAMAAYAKADKTAKAAIWTDIANALGGAGLAPKVLVYAGSDVVPARTSVYTLGRTEIYFIEILSKGEIAADGGNEVDVQFAGPGELYNLRPPVPEGEYLGATDTVTMPVPPSGPIIIARTAVRLTGLMLQISLEGTSLHVSAQVQATERVGDRLLQLEFYSPSGQRAVQLDRAVKAEGGTYLGVVALPLNTSLGTWRVLARDTETGMASWLSVLIEQQESETFVPRYAGRVNVWGGGGRARSSRGRGGGSGGGGFGSGG